MKTFKIFFLIEIWSKWNFNQSFDWLLINQSHLTIYTAYIAHQKEPIYGISKESEIFTKFNKYLLKEKYTFEN